MEKVVVVERETGQGERSDGTGRLGGGQTKHSEVGGRVRALVKRLRG